jgi:hypothetical protein
MYVEQFVKTLQGKGLLRKSRSGKDIALRRPRRVQRRNVGCDSRALPAFVSAR